MKRGQFWYNDFILAFSILAVIGLIFVASMLDITSRNEDIEDLYDEAISLSSNLMSSGSNVLGWGGLEGNVGIVDNSKVSLVKLQAFDSISSIEEDYNTIAKPLMGVVNDFAFYFVGKDGDVISYFNFNGGYSGNGYFGNPSFNGIENLEADNIVIFTRFVYLDASDNGNGEIMRMVVVTWN